MSETLTSIDPLLTGRIADSLEHIYSEAFAEAPYDEGPEDSSRFRTRLIEHSALPGFRLVVATVDVPVGFAYGYRAHAGDWWAETVFSEIPGHPELRLDDVFIFMEIAVHPERRCTGIGWALHDSLLVGVECHTACSLPMTPRFPSSAPMKGQAGGISSDRSSPPAAMVRMTRWKQR